ncbi:MAG TPA: cytidine deaminase [Chitinophagaceae bacterium]|nr:cytidine deaminase [Chitinophagaceae bacterium]
MMKKNFEFVYDVYDSIEELDTDDALLLKKARETTSLAYAPYSKFNVAAAARLSNGEIVTGTNQENASYPVGLCAERVLLSSVSSLHPQVPVETVAVSYKSDIAASDHPIAPCGICRQSLHEYEFRLNHPIRLILGGMEGKIFVIPSAAYLLPFSFTKDDLG